MADLPTRGCLSKARMRPRSPPTAINQEHKTCWYWKYSEVPNGHQYAYYIFAKDEEKTKNNWKCRFQLSPNWLDRMCGLEEGVRPNFRPNPTAWRASRLLRR